MYTPDVDLQRLATPKQQGCTHRLCSASARQKVAGVTLPTDALLCSWRSEDELFAGRALTPPIAEELLKKSSESLIPIQRSKPFSALRTVPHRRLQRAQRAHKIAEGRAVVEHFVLPSTAANSSDTAVQRLFKRTRTRIEEVASKATRVNMLALRNISRAYHPVGPKLGSEHFSYVPDDWLDASGTKQETTSMIPHRHDDLSLQILQKHECITLHNNLEAPDLAIVLSMLREYSYINNLDFGTNKITGTALSLLEELVDVNENILSVTGGIKRGVPLELPYTVQRLLRRNQTLNEARKKKSMHLEKLKAASKNKEMHKKCVEDVLDSEWVARRVLVHTQAEARQGLKTQVMKNYSALRIQLARSERRRRLMVCAFLTQTTASQLHLMNVEIKEASDRPVIEEQMERELFIILDNIEAHWRQQVANEESEQRSKTRKESFSSWEKYYKKEKQRYLFERFERCNLEGEEGTARLVIKEEEFTDFSHVMEAADESWGDVERVLLARAQREEEERRRIAAKLAEEERERQWKKEKQQKEEERLQYERQRVRERMQKEERKIRQVFKKTEEAARGFLKEMIDQEYKITEVASHLQRVLHERYLELCKPPVITLAYEKLRGHAVVYFEECSNPVNLWFPDQKLQISLPGGWYERLEVLEKQAAKHAKSEIALRNDLDPKISTLVEQLKTVLKNNELPFTTCNRPNIHRTKEYIMKSVLFPAIDHVAAEKVRIWGGSVQCNVTRDPIALGPNSGIDVVTINDSEHDCAFERIKEATNMIEVGLDDMGGVTVEDLDALMKDFLYYSLGKGDAPYNRTVSFTIKLDVVSLLEVELETYRNDEGAVQCVPLEKPYQKDIIAAPFEWSCFLIVLHPYIQFAPGTFNVTSLKRVGQKVDVGASVYFSSSPRNSILVDSFPSLKDTYQFEYHEDACQASSLLPFDVTVSVPTSHTISQDLSAITVQHNIHSFENASLTISIVTGWTPNDLVMVSTTGAITYSTSSGMLILDNEPVATISREMKPVSSHPGMYTMAPVEVGNVHEVLCMQFVGNVGKLKMKSVLQNLFYCNNIIDPMVGVREMQLTITDAEGLFCVVPFNIEVKWTDVPTKLVVEETKLCFRTPCQPDIYEQHLAFIEHNTLPLMPDVRLVDPDTREFCGGYVVATLTAEGLTPTEGLLIDVSPNCKVGISVDTASKDEKDGTMNKDVFFNGNLFAHACFKTGQNSDEFTELTLDFVVDGGATVEIAQELLRSICYYNKALKTIPLAVRTVEISLLVGPSMLKKDVHGNVIEHEIVSKGKPITLSLQVRTTMPSIRVPQKHACMKYLEGSGVKRLGPFEVATDEDACTKDWGGFVKVEVVQGCEEGDVLLLKEDHGIRIIKLEDVTSEDKDEFPLDWKKRKSSIFNLDEFNESDDDQNEADQASDKSDVCSDKITMPLRTLTMMKGALVVPCH